MCNNPLCKFINIIQIKNGVKVSIHYDDEDEAILVQYWDDNKCFERCFVPNETDSPAFPSAVKKIKIKKENFYLTNINILTD